MPMIVVEREFDPPMEPAELDALAKSDNPCLRLRHVSLVHSYLSKDGRRGVCVFEGPDAESVREANREAGVPFVHAWPATVHEPPAK
jgi:hypothetical protein